MKLILTGVKHWFRLRYLFTILFVALVVVVLHKYGFSVWSAIIGVLFVIVAFEPTINPPTTDSAKLVYRILFVGLGVTQILVSILQEKQQQSSDDSNATTIRQLTNIVDGISRKLSTNDAQVQNILLLVATNTTINPDLRLMILQQKSQSQTIGSNIISFENLQREFQNHRASLKIYQEKQETRDMREAYNACSAIFDGAIRQLMLLVDVIANPKGLKANSDYSGIPLPTNGFNRPIHVGTVSVGTNSLWTFDISFTIRSTGTQVIEIKSETATLTLNVRNGNRLATTLAVGSEQPTEEVYTDITDGLSKSLRYFIAVQNPNMVRTGTNK